MGALVFALIVTVIGALLCLYACYLAWKNWKSHE